MDETGLSAARLSFMQMGNEGWTNQLTITLFDVEKVNILNENR